MATTRYFLSPSIHWCAVNGRCIILDVATDRYLQVSADTFQSLLPFVADADNSGDPSSPRRGIPAELSKTADELFAANVLTRVPAPSMPRRPLVSTPTELVSLVPYKGMRADSLRALPYFSIACATADYYLRRSTMSRIYARVYQRKHRYTRSPRATDQTQVVRLTLIYQSLRPFYPRDYLCLFDSLSLLELLAHWQLFPDWVFGVKVDPFAAHCWLQYGNVVLSDTVNFSSRWYSPIMVI